MKIAPKPPIDVFVGNLSKQQILELSAFRDKNRSAFRWWVEPNTQVAQWTMRWKDCISMSPVVLSNGNCLFNWDINKRLVIQADKAQESLYVRFINQSIHFLFLSPFTLPKNHLVLFEESYRDPALPKEFLTIPAFSTCADLSQFCMSSGLISFSLADISRFVKDDIYTRQEGTFVGKEIDTGRYWYLDQLHGDHYEVFSKFRKHEGIADLNGNLIPGTQVKGRTI